MVPQRRQKQLRRLGAADLQLHLGAPLVVVLLLRTFVRQDEPLALLDLLRAQAKTLVGPRQSSVGRVEVDVRLHGLAPTTSRRRRGGLGSTASRESTFSLGLDLLVPYQTTMLTSLL